MRTNRCVNVHGGLPNSQIGPAPEPTERHASPHIATARDMGVHSHGQRAHGGGGGGGAEWQTAGRTTRESAVLRCGEPGRAGGSAHGLEESLTAWAAPGRPAAKLREGMRSYEKVCS